MQKLCAENFSKKGKYSVRIFTALTAKRAPELFTRFQHSKKNLMNNFLPRHLSLILCKD